MIWATILVMLFLLFLSTHYRNEYPEIFIASAALVMFRSMIVIIDWALQ